LKAIMLERQSWILPKLPIRLQKTLELIFRASQLRLCSCNTVLHELSFRIGKKPAVPYVELIN
jgi:hypothetical protein